VLREERDPLRHRHEVLHRQRRHDRPSWISHVQRGM
jgi:hypothetical protein